MVNTRATSTSVNCTPASSDTNHPVTCTATVTDTDVGTMSTPSGTVSFTSSGTGTFTGSPCTLSGAGATATCSVTYTATGTAPRTDTITGTYSGDSTHNTSSGTFMLGVTPDEPPTASFTESLTTAPTGTAILFNATASRDPDGTIVTYTWDFGDGTTGTGVTVSHSYANTGNAASATFTVTLTVTDSSGMTASTTSVKTITDRPPTASFTFSPTKPVVGQTVTFDASASADPDGTIISYAWTFGDGTTGTGKMTTHAYNVSGNFSVTLAVTDNSGLGATTSQIVPVTQPTNQGHCRLEDAQTEQEHLTFGQQIKVTGQGGNDGNVQVSCYIRFHVTNGDGATTNLYGSVVSLAPKQTFGDQDNNYGISFTPQFKGIYTVIAQVYFTTTPGLPAGDPAYQPDTTHTVTFTFTVT